MTDETETQPLNEALAEIVAANATIMALLAAAMVKSGAVTREGLQPYLDEATRHVEQRYRGPGKTALVAFRDALDQTLR